MLEITVKVLTKNKSLMQQLWEPRHQRGWYGKASKWLTEQVEQDGGRVEGNVSQCAMTFASTILQVESTKGRYFLKAPAAGSDEIKVTHTVQKLMPERTLDVVGISEELGSFVSRELRLLLNRQESEAILRGAGLKMLVDFQLESIKYVSMLKKVECPVIPSSTPTVLMSY